MSKISVFDDARSIAKSRPVFVERHDFSATLYRDREMTEPSVAFASKGEYRFDIVKIICGIVLVFAWFSSVSILVAVRRLRKKRKKALRQAARAARKAAKQAD
jgi:transposase